MKEAVSLRLDADVLAWLKKDGQGLSDAGEPDAAGEDVEGFGFGVDVRRLRWERLIRYQIGSQWALLGASGRVEEVGGTAVSEHLQMLIEAARSHTMSPEERQAQRRSFAYGNTKIENDLITRKMVDEQDELLKTEFESR